MRRVEQVIGKIPEFDIIQQPNEEGDALMRRVSDGRTAWIPLAWFKQRGDTWIPKNAIKNIQIAGLDWA